MKVFLFFSILLNSILSKLLSTTEWDGESLFNYISPKIKAYQELLQYIIIDPDEILNVSTKVKIGTKMKEFYNDKNVINYLIIFYSMNKTQIDIENIIGNFSLLMKNTFAGYNENNVLISAFAFDNEKSTIKTGSRVKESFPDSTALKILNKTNTELKNKDYP